MEKNNKKWFLFDGFASSLLQEMRQLQRHSVVCWAGQKSVRTRLTWSQRDWRRSFTFWVVSLTTYPHVDLRVRLRAQTCVSALICCTLSWLCECVYVCMKMSLFHAYQQKLQWNIFTVSQYTNNAALLSCFYWKILVCFVTKLFGNEIYPLRKQKLYHQ